MALKDNWIDKVDGEDILVKDTNDIAQAVIELENENENFDEALDRIIEIQNSLIGGDSV